MHRVFASTGAFIGRPNGRDIRLIKEIGPKICCDGFELMFYGTWRGNEEKIAGFLSDSGFLVPTVHCDKDIGELLAQQRYAEAFGIFRKNCEAAKITGAGLLVLHLWNGPTSDDNIEANFAGCPRLYEIADEYGVILTVENVIAHGGSPLRHWHSLVKMLPCVRFTYDTKMAQFDFDNEKAFLPQNLPLWERVSHVHLNDRRGGYRDWSDYRALNLGRGDVDFDTFFEGLRTVGYKGDFTVEANAFKKDGVLDIDGLNASLERARELIKKYLK